jgi:HK97 family phage prohead protease
MGNVVLQIAEPTDAKARLEKLYRKREEDLRTRGRLPDGDSAEIEFLEGVEKRGGRLAVKLAPGGIALKFAPNEQREPLSIRPEWDAATSEWTWQVFSGETPWSKRHRNLADAAAQVLALVGRKGLADADIVRKRFIPGETKIHAGVTKDAEGHFHFECIASSSRPDLDGDIIEQGGWVLPSHLPILASHERASWPVAKTEHIRLVGDKLVVVGLFPPTGSSSKSDEARMLVAAGVLRGVSVGFRPIAKPVPNVHGGFTFSRQQLNEISLVAVPAQPEALVLRTW